MPSTSHPASKKRPRQENPSSFLSFLETHRRIMEIFFTHQEALLRCDFPLALQRLRQYERAIKRHIREEEDFLMPLYGRAGKVPGGARELFTGEHQRIIEFIERLKKMLPRRRGTGKKAARRAMEILYQEAMFRWLMEHHDERERQILYPVLDRITTTEERAKVLNECFSREGF